MPTPDHAEPLTYEQLAQRQELARSILSNDHDDVPTVREILALAVLAGEIHPPPQQTGEA